MFYGNGKPNYFLFTDNQAVEHIATQPNMNDHSRSIDIRHHAIRQDYVNGLMRIGGVATHDNTSDILTKNLQPPLHIKHVRELKILQQLTQTNLQNCVMGVTLRGSHRTNATRNGSLAHAHQLALDPPMESNRPRILTNQQNRNKNICGPVWVRATLRSKSNPPTEHHINCSDRHCLPQSGTTMVVP
jgi:hypothetical protein